MSFANRISQLFGIQYPIIQAGMVWCSGWKLASAVSNAGGLGLIGAGSMNASTLREHIQKTKAATPFPFGVNLPLIYPEIEKQVDVILSERVPIIFTSAGSPLQWTNLFKEKGMTVVHVVSSLKFALKAQEAGVDAIVGEGFEAGGHNGREETTTFCLLPLLKQSLRVPLIAAGGIYSGSTMLAAFALGAEGVQIGSRFAVSEESSAHERYKHAVLNAKEGDTDLILKKLTPVRMLKNPLHWTLKQMEGNGATDLELKELLGKGRSKRGIMDGDLEEGELEIGQVSVLLNQIQSAAAIVEEIWSEFLTLRKALLSD